MKKFILFLYMACFLCAPVYGAGIKAEKSYLSERSGILASRYNMGELSIPYFVSVITLKEIRNSTSKTLADLLRTEAGIMVSDLAGNGRLFNVDLRGFGETAQFNTLVLVDGRKVTQPDMSGTDWVHIPLNRVKRIEIIRGGMGSVLYGDNAAGGIINIITEYEEEAGSEINFEWGSYNSFYSALGTNMYMENFGYGISASYRESGGYRNNSASNATDTGFNLEFYPAPSGRLLLSAGYHQDYADIPGFLKDSELESGFDRKDSLRPGNTSETEDYYYKVRPEIGLYPGTMLAADFSHRKRRYVLSYTSGDLNLTDRNILETFEFLPQFILETGQDGSANRFIAGYDYRETSEGVSRKSTESGPALDRLEKNGSAYYFHNELILSGGTVLSAGYRRDSAKYRFNPGTPENLKYDDTSYNFGFTFGTGNAQLYFSYARGFRYPLLDEIYDFESKTVNLTLKHQKTHNYELGIRQDHPEGVSSQLNFFRLETDDELFFDSSQNKSVNLDGRANREGVEFAMGKKLPGFLIGVSWSWVKPVIENGAYAGKTIPNVADQKGTFKAVMDLEDGFALTFNGIFVGKRYFAGDFSNTQEKLEEYTVFNFRLSQKVGRNSVFIIVNNITDQRYSDYGETSGSERAYYPSPERSYLIGFSFEL